MSSADLGLRIVLKEKAKNRRELMMMKGRLVSSGGKFFRGFCEAWWGKKLVEETIVQRLRD